MELKVSARCCRQPSLAGGKASQAFKGVMKSRQGWRLVGRFEVASRILAQGTSEASDLLMGKLLEALGSKIHPVTFKGKRY